MAEGAAPAAHPAVVLLSARNIPDARERARSLADAEARILALLDGHAVTAEADPAEAVRRALRDAVAYTERRLARVFEGRLVTLQSLQGGKTAPGVPESRLAVTLEAEEDTRVLHLEGAWAWNLAASGARTGDIVQIARDGPFVTRRSDRTSTEGRVLDERDHILRIRLGAIDQAHATDEGVETASMTGTTLAPSSGGAREDADPDLAVLMNAARLPEFLFATGERPATGPRARSATDNWLRRRLASSHASLEPGFLLVTHAADLPAPAVAALRAVASAPGRPRVLLADEDQEHADATRRRFADAHMT